MRNKFVSIISSVTAAFFCLLFFFLLTGCSRQGESNLTSEELSKAACLKPDSVNPNGTSELAKLMRDMHVHAANVRDSILHNRPIGVYPVRFEKMYTANATDPKVRSVAFDGFTANYLSGLKNIYTAADSRRHSFNQMVEQCITCHNQYCTGPVKTISKLKIPEAGL